MALEIKCQTCGHTVSDQTEDQLVAKIQKHNQEHHQQATPAEEARQAIREQNKK